jgi:hypothetical protein
MAYKYGESNLKPKKLFSSAFLNSLQKTDKTHRENNVRQFAIQFSFPMRSY